MTLISDTIPNLVNGVSQQAPAIRLASQCEAQENMVSSIVENLTTRPPTEHNYKLLDFDMLTTREDVLLSSVHIINRDVNERYRVIIVKDIIKVFDLDGIEKTIATPDGTDYLLAADQRTSIRAISIKDHTLIVNRDIVTAMDDTIHNPEVNEALIFIKQASNSTTMNITLDTHDVTFMTDTQGYSDSNYLTGPDGNGTDPVPVPLDTSFISECIAEDFINNHPDISDYEITYSRAVIHVKRVDGGTFDLEATDTRSDTHIDIIKGKANRISSLPLTAPDGFYVEIEEDDTNDWDNYYVKFVADEETEFTSGIWREVVKNGIPSKLDKTTMPHVLVREEDGNFTFKQAEWGDRAAGDLITSPDPSFIGNTINDVFLARNRLGLLADINFVSSRAEDLFEMFNSTATTAVDSDPIDKPPSDAGVSVLNHAVANQDRILFFSDQAQFMLEYPETFSNKTVDIIPLTSFESSSNARPLKAGKVVMFPSDNGDFSGIQEYYFTGENDLVADAADISAALPSYIPKGITKMVGSTTVKIMLVLSPEDPRILYAYKYYWNSNEKIQSAWSRYTFYAGTSSEIVSMDFINTTLHMTVCHADGLYAEEIDFSAAATDPGHTYVNRLDSRVDESQVTLSYDGDTDKTTMTLPYDLTGADIEDYTLVLRSDLGVLLQGFTPKIFSIVTNAVVIEGDLTLGEFYFGKTYKQFYIFSNQYLREQSDGGGFNIIRAGRLQMKYWELSYTNTGSFTVTVTPRGGATYRYVFTGNIIGDVDTTIGQVTLKGGHFKFPVGAKNDEVVIGVESKSHLPLSLINAEWTADFNSLSKRA